jgi:hypothetical protein
MTAYGEFRCSFDHDPNDQRIVFYGIRHIIETYIARQWTEKDVELTEAFMKTHNAGYTEFEFPKALFLKVRSLHSNPIKRVLIQYSLLKRIMDISQSVLKHYLKAQYVIHIHQFIKLLLQENMHL